jgi:glycerophosphoryl diester phosphodiesterase
MMTHQLLAHRGGSGLRPENTLAAFENALNLGCDGAELDVHLTKDGLVVVHHNSCLNHCMCRKSSGEWITKDEELALSELTFLELQQFEVGLPNPATDIQDRFTQLVPVAGQKIPLLAEVIRLVKASSDTFELLVEIKSSVVNEDTASYLELVDAVLEVLSQENFLDRSVLCSFDWGSLIYAKSRNDRVRTWFTVHPLSWLAGGLPPTQDIPPSEDYLKKLRAIFSVEAPWYAGFDPRKFNNNYAQAVAAAGGDGLFMYYTDCAPDRVNQLKEFDLVAAAWSVNLRDPEGGRRLLDSGLDANCTDYPN